MNQLRVDPASGFMESASKTNIYTFDSDRKNQLLDLAKREAEQGAWPSIPMLCKSIGIAVQTFYNHLNADEGFRNEWAEVKKALEDAIAVDMAKHSKRPSNYMDRVTLLRHLNPGEWGGEARTQINVDIGFIKKLADALDANKQPVIAVEAEISKPIDAA